MIAANGARSAPEAARRTWKDVRWPRVLVLLFLLFAWQAVTSLGLVSPRVLASPSTVAHTGLTLLASGELPRHLWVSLGRVSRGLALGVSAGVTLALVTGLFRLGEDLLDAPIQMLRTLPVLALVPLFILWFGIGETPKIALVSLGTFFPVYVNTYAGIRSVDNRLVEAATTLGLGRLDLVAHVVLPGALPSALVGLRHSMGVAWLVLVISEQINATAGIGYLMTNAREFLRTDIIVLGLVIYALLGLSTDLFVRWLERNVLSWRAAFAGR
ncbi:ABC transporter permease subunit [Sorangium sp. So ce136]|uniref:ABC transporter permease subunit n=1 Tax=Sorangium sp. So ce136 TaxID=3133284 RepID=UPI003F054163